MATFPSPHFQLASNQTALALIVPPPLQPNINSLRQVHDRAFRKWDPHINILYPFVEPARLSSAVAILRERLEGDPQIQRLDVEISQVGVFRHRKNATVFLRPSPRSEESICKLRNVLVHSLGCSPRDGTYDGVFRPHLTVGQAGFQGSSIEKLTDQVQKLAGIDWEGTKLAVLKRETSGEMKIVEEISLGRSTEESQQNKSTYSIDNGWRTCYSFTPQNGWSANFEFVIENEVTERKNSTVTIMTYNLMAENFAPPFKSRLELIINALSSPIAASTSSLNVLCLQEINEEMLLALLSEPFIRTNFPFSTHLPSAFLPSHRNLITLASAPFMHFLLPFSERHKTALVIATQDPPLEVANVHLTSALSHEAVQAKLNQMETLTRFLKDERTSGKEVIIAGDFNLTTSSRTIETAVTREFINPETARLIPKVVDSGIWEDAFNFASTSQADKAYEVFEGEEGATFDRLTNHLAAMSKSPIDNRPQRYDRVLFRKGGSILVETFENFGLPTDDGTCASDHYGTCVSFRTKVSEHTPSQNGLDVISGQRSNRILIVEDSTNLRDIIEPYLPTLIDREQRQNALKLLRQTLSKNRSISDLIFVPLGSYCMDTYFADSDVDILVIGSVSPNVFFDFATSQLRALNTDGPHAFKGVHFVNSLVPVVEVGVMGIKFDLQYSQAAEILEKHHAQGPEADLSTLVFDTQLISSLSPNSIRPLNTYRDTAFILGSVPDLSSYQTAHRYLSLYLEHRGLYSAKFGYLGGIHLSLMLNRVVKLIGVDNEERKGSPATIIRTFFAYYAAFNWAQDNITDPTLPSHRNPSRSLRDSIFIYSIHTPTARPNVASSCTLLTGQTLTHEFSLASEKLHAGDWQWCHRPKEASVADFLDGFGAFVRVEVDVWDVDDTSGDKVREMVGSLESRFPRLMVALGRVGGLDGRIWPARFQRGGEERAAEAQAEGQFKGYYLVGVSACEGGGLDVQMKRLFTGKVTSVLREFEESVKESRELQDGNTWVSMELMSKKKILDLDLVIDERDWGRIGGGEDAQTALNIPNIPVRQNVPSLVPSRASHQRMPSASLRPAQDIISRIHWDSALSVDDFVIGYEDRFVGVKEIPLAKWKSEQTDEEFIPRHRIVWIRKTVEEGEKVWDRRQKVDLIFNSGISKTT